jgi:hypothetical protein
MKPLHLPSSGRDWAILLVAILIAPGVAVLAGMASASGSPMTFALVVGTLVGAGLLIQPKIAFWMTLVGCLVVTGLVYQFLPDWQKATWAVSILGFLLLAVVVIRVLAEPHGRHPAIWIALAFIAYAVIVSLIGETSAPALATAFKRYFQTWGIFFALAVLPFALADAIKLGRYLIYFAFLQIPFILYQFVFIVPRRVGLGDGIVPADAVSGTFEADFWRGGGSQGSTSLVLSLAVAYLVKVWLAGRLSGRATLLYSLVLVVGMAVGEAKVIIVTLPLAVLFVARQELAARPMAAVGVGLVGLAVLLVLGFLYLTLGVAPGISLEKALEMTIAYNFGDTGYSSVVALNRSTVLSFWWQQQSWENPLLALFGHGLGASFAGDSASLAQGELAIRYAGMGIGLTAASSILWDLGLVGISLVLALSALAWHSARRAADANRGTPLGDLMSVAEAGVILVVVLLFYSAQGILNLGFSGAQSLILGLAILGSRLAAVHERSPVAVSAVRGRAIRPNAPHARARRGGAVR